jgi:hypothetical protein
VRNADRVSLILFNEEVLTVADAAGIQDLPELTKLVDSLEPHGGTNVIAALQLAVSHARDAVSGIRYRREVVMITDDQMTPLSGEALRIHALVRNARESGVRLSVVDLDGQMEKSFLHDLAVDSAGSLLKASSGDELGWSLTEVLLGQKPVVAEDAQVTVHFNPKLVAAYRLIGHESTGLGGMLPAESETALRLGETATLLFEVGFNSEDESQVGYVDLKWTDPRTGALQRRRRAILREHFVDAYNPAVHSVSDAFFSGSEALQRAAFAAEVAEVLRQSPFVTTKSRGLNHVKKAATNLSGHLRQQPDVVRLLELADKAK